MRQMCTNGCDRPRVGNGLCQPCYNIDRAARLKAELTANGGFRLCANCNEVIPSDRDKRAIFCTTECYQEGRAARQKSSPKGPDRCCAACDQLFTPYALNSQTCSPSCAIKWNNTKLSAKRTEVRREAREARPQRICQAPDCTNPIPQERKNLGLYCSSECKKKVNYASWNARASSYNRNYKYGITDESWDAQLEFQEYACDNCRSEDWGSVKGPHQDHNHETGQNRGILCYSCNLMIGHSKEDLARLRAAIAYLEKWTMIAQADKLVVHPNWPANIDPQLIASLRVLT